MSESTNTVADAFSALTTALRQEAFNGNAADFKRIAEYVEATGTLQNHWNSGLPVSGVVKAKPGRKPKAASNGAAEASGEGEAVSETAFEGPAPSRSSRRGGQPNA